MASPELRDIMSGPQYVGPVLGTKSEYHVFKTARGDYVVFSSSNRGKTSFHVTFVSAANVEALTQFIPEEGTTTGSLLKDARVAEIFGIEERDALYFEVLTTLYILTARGDLQVTKEGRTLVFAQKKESDPIVEDAPERPPRVLRQPAGSG